MLHDLDKIFTQVVETPFIVLTLLTGFPLLMSYPNPSGILYIKILCGVAAAGANLFCVKKVLDRDHWAKPIPIEADPMGLDQGKAFSRVILSTGAAIPFTFVALYIAVAYL